MNALAYARAANPFAIVHQGLGLVDAKAEALAVLLEIAEITLALVAKVEIVTDHQMPGLQAVNQYALHEFFGARRGEFRIKMQT